MGRGERSGAFTDGQESSACWAGGEVGKSAMGRPLLKRGIKDGSIWPGEKGGEPDREGRVAGGEGLDKHGQGVRDVAERADHGEQIVNSRSQRDQREEDLLRHTSKSYALLEVSRKGRYRNLSKCFSANPCHPE